MKLKVIAVLLGLLLSANVFAKKVEKNEVKATAEPTPVISVDTPITFMDGDIDYWEKAGETIRDNPNIDLTLRVSGYGGDVMAGERFIKNLLDAEQHGAKIHMRVVAPTYSMHAMLVCAGTDWSIEEGATIMFHEMAGYNSALLGLIDYESTASDPAFENTQNFLLDMCISKGLLTPEDKANILQGKEVYLVMTHDGLVKYTSRVSKVGDLLVRSVVSSFIDTVFLLLMLSVIVFIIRRVGK